MPDRATRHRIALEAARTAGDHLRTLYAQRDTLQIEQKGLNDFVSRADREAEAMIRNLVRDTCPGDAFIGEETGMSGGLDARAVWVVDPLDGTTNFLRGAHNWCVSIGIVEDGEPTIGVIYDPLRDELFESFAGGGARMNGVPIRVSDVTALDHATIGLGFVQRVGAKAFGADTVKLLSQGLSFRQVGAGALMLAYCAAGRVDCYYERHMWPWDALGGLALIREAGGTVSNYPTGPTLRDGASVLAASPALFPALQAALEG